MSGVWYYTEDVNLNARNEHIKDTFDQDKVAWKYGLNECMKTKVHKSRFKFNSFKYGYNNYDVRTRPVSFFNYMEMELIPRCLKCHGCYR